jgi:hypothetical protein
VRSFATGTHGDGKDFFVPFERDVLPVPYRRQSEPGSTLASQSVRLMLSGTRLMAVT